jgi:hypothetical protein
MKQIEHAIRLRDAAVELLRKQGTRDSEGNVVFDKATPSNSYPRLSLLLSRFPPDGRFNLSVWAPREDWYGKVLSVEWLGDRIKLINFLRGEWELDLLAVAALTQ